MGFPEDEVGLLEQAAEQRRLLDELTAEDVANDEGAARRKGDLLWRLGEDLYRLGRFDEAAVELGKAASVLWPLDDQRYVSVFARQRQAMALVAVGESQAALELINNLVGDIGLDWSDPAEPDVMAALIRIWLPLLRDSGSMDRVRVVADHVLGWPMEETTPAQRLTIAMALGEKATILLLRAEFDQAVVMFDEMIELAFAEAGGDLDGDAMYLFASGLVRRAYALEQAGRLEDATAAYELVLVRFADSSEPDMQRMCADARDGKNRISGD